MKMASCVYGMHLDMNPHHTGFIFTNITELKGRNYKSRAPRQADGDRYGALHRVRAEGLLLHDAPRSDAAVARGRTRRRRRAWEPDPGVQPAPAWMAGLWHASVGGRRRARDRAGARELPRSCGHERARLRRRARRARTSSPTTMRIACSSRSRSARRSAKHLRGLATDGRIALPMSGGEHSAALVASEDGQLTIASPRELASVPAHVDAVELPLLIDDGKRARGLACRLASARRARADARGSRVCCTHARRAAASRRWPRR